jgi:hypothetical protein
VVTVRAVMRSTAARSAGASVCSKAWRLVVDGDAVAVGDEQFLGACELGAQDAHSEVVVEEGAGALGFAFVGGGMDAGHFGGDGLGCGVRAHDAPRCLRWFREGPGSNALAGLHKRHYGKGPVRAKTFLVDNTVLYAARVLALEVTARVAAPRSRTRSATSVAFDSDRTTCASWAVRTPRRQRRGCFGSEARDICATELGEQVLGLQAELLEQAGVALSVDLIGQLLVGVTDLVVLSLLLEQLQDLVLGDLHGASFSS